MQLQDVLTGKPVLAHRGSVNWNPFCRRWVLITVELGGTSMLGEIWYAEADTPLGPWVYARKIVSHDRYSFYNPKQHPQFDQDHGRFIFFEGTYTTLFSGNTAPTPRYDYNQIMYKLDLADTRLVLPVPVYQFPGQKFRCRVNTPLAPGTEIAFYALDRPGQGSVPVYEINEGKGRTLRTGPLPPQTQRKLVFHALAADTPKPAPVTVPLYVFQHQDGRRVFTVPSSSTPPGFQRSDQPLCRVWRNPMRVPLPGP